MPTPFELSELTEVTGTSGDPRLDAMFATKDSFLVPFELRDTLEGKTITKWGGDFGTAPELTFSFFDSDSVFSNDYPSQYNGAIGTLPDYLKDSIRSAVEMWSRYTKLKILEVQESTSDVGDVRIGVSESNQNFQFGSIAEAVVPIEGRIFSGDVYISPQLASMPARSFERGEINYTTLLHELGHSIFSLADVSNVLGWNGEALPEDLNYRTFTIMSYSALPGSTVGESPLFVDLSHYPTTPMILDILAAQWLYGADTSTNAGDDIYTFNNSEVYFETIWDAGGRDIFDASSASSSLHLDLRPGALSDVGRDVYAGAYAVTKSLGIAYGAQIEDAIGGFGSDIIIGNSSNNALSGQAGNDQITGGLGDDVLDGGSGFDTAVYSGAQSSYTLTLGQGAFTIEDRRSDGEGTDALVGIEFLDFDIEIPAMGGNPLDLSIFGGPTALGEEQFSDLIELYIAYFNRAPDATGLYFWATSYSNGQPLEEIAALFLDQDETRALYPEGSSNEIFLENVYNNVLGRQSDEGGFQFWLNNLNTGALQRDTFILNLLGGAQGSDVDFLEDKVDIGTYFAVIKGLSNADAGSQVMDLFDGSQASIEDAIQATDQFYSDALDPDTGEFLMPLVGVVDNPFSIG